MDNGQGIDIPEKAINTLAYLIAKYAIIEAQKAHEGQEVKSA